MTTERLVHIVDDDASVRRAAALLLRTQGYLVESHASGVAFLDKVKDSRPGCVLLDVRMPEVDGIGVLEQLGKTEFDWPVIIMTAHGDIATAVAAMRLGARNFIEKPFEEDTLLLALDDGFALLSRKDELDLTVAAAMARLECLTPREREVLDGLAAGQTNKMIALDLGISPRTVEIHRANLMDKLGVQTLPQALRIALVVELGGHS
ncbi:response regulator transcription factor [Sphingomonas canadensis]|uniref:Response regulator transcription factor n=1 Tax=Sphingomonas canadensis TaxID=1219257 RepID=A0ABW3H814_9SPHN|nr:response regulator [Sphingomonas canadensis]MCW3837298.1 response regulator [Sphingomonas canadensis]